MRGPNQRNNSFRGECVALTIPDRLLSACEAGTEMAAWVAGLPRLLQELTTRWSLVAGDPFAEASCSWAAPVQAADGSTAVLKVAMPHMEGRDEIAGLRFWSGEPTVRLLAADEKTGAMLLERCEPGTPLRALPDLAQDTVISKMLQRLWRRPEPTHPFRHLSLMIEYWSDETRRDSEKWHDAGLVHAGLDLFRELSIKDSSNDVLLATDLHAGNVLRSQREEWLVIDPKPFVGDRAYDTTQHLFNCRGTLRLDPEGTIRHLADLLEVNAERIRQWTFARAAAEPRDDWDDERTMLARLLAP